MPIPPRPKKSVLIVDDEDNVEMLRHFFGDSDLYEYEVDRTPESDPKRLAQALDRKPYDVFIVDLELDAPTEETALRLGNLVIEVQSMERPEVPIIVFSAHDEISEVIHAMRLGATDFVGKDTEGYANLVKAVDASLKEVDDLGHELRNVERILEKRPPKLLNPQSGERFFVFAKDKMRARGHTRFEALYKYRKLCIKRHDLPRKPVVLELPPVPVPAAPSPLHAPATKDVR